MPASEKSSRDFARIVCSCKVPTAAKTGAACPETTVGLALCATTQIRHEAESIRFG